MLPSFFVVEYQMHCKCQQTRVVLHCTSLETDIRTATMNLVHVSGHLIHVVLCCLYLALDFDRLLKHINEIYSYGAIVFGVSGGPLVAVLESLAHA